jgi:Domain of unknown function (DUF4432)
MTKTISVFNTQTTGHSETWNASALGGQGNFSITQKTLRGGLSDGVETLEIHNGLLKFIVVPTRGMGIWKAWLNDFEIGWQSPVRGPVHPAFVDLGEPGGLGWLDGFDELFVRCGLVSNGAPEFADNGKLLYPLHGRIANRPAHDVSVSFNAATNTLSVRGVVEESRFHITKLRLTSTISTQLGSNKITVVDAIENFAETPQEVQMLYHVNFGTPLLEAGAQVVFPYKTLVPRNAHAAGKISEWDYYPAPTPGLEEQVYFFDLYADNAGTTQVMLKNAHGDKAAVLEFNPEHLPCFSLWKNPAGLRDGYVTGLEPGTNFPNPRSFEGQHGRVLKLAAGQTASLVVSLQLLDNASAIQQAEQKITEIVGGRPQQTHAAPQDDWCAK